MGKSQAIIPVKLNVGYLEARSIAERMGSRLPSNVLHDDILLFSDKWVELAKSGYYSRGAFADEISVHPAKGRSFSNRRDIVDSRTGWVLPISEAIATADRDFIGVPRAGLLVVPESVGIEGGRAVVHPGKITVYSPRVETFGVEGKVDMEIRMPIDIGQGRVEAKLSQSIDPLPSESLRWMYCCEGETVAPIKRYVQDFRRGIFEVSWSKGDLYSAGIVASP